MISNKTHKALYLSRDELKELIALCEYRTDSKKLKEYFQEKLRLWDESLQTGS